MKKPNKTAYKTQLFRLTSSVVNWLSAAFNHENEKSAEVRVSPKTLGHLMLALDTICYNRGEAGLILHIKSLRSSLVEYLKGTHKRVLGIRTDIDGLPKILGSLRSQFRGTDSPALLQLLPLLNTILWSTRALKIGRQPDLSPITHPPRRVTTWELTNGAEVFWKELGYRRQRQAKRHLEWQSYRLTTKGGPNGQALVSAITDLYSLPEELVKDIKVLGGRKLGLNIDLLREKDLQPKLAELFDTGTRSLRRITSFPDAESKVRVIAILDYWSQEALRPLHDFVFQVLKRIPQDCTFDQRAFKDKLAGGSIYYSVDLTQATDRFPIGLIKFILEGYFPAKYVESWYNVMVGYPFDFQNRKVSYSTGNPMGAYSSWATFALSNHYVVWHCCKRLNKNWKSLQYTIIGDDVVIADKEVAEMYIQTMRSHGLEVSELKTHVSPIFYEFAKRLIYRNHEITPFPISAIKETSKRYFLLTSLLIEETRRGWIAKDGIPGAIEKFYTTVRPLRRSLRRKLVMWADATEQVIKFTRGSITANECITNLNRRYGLHKDKVFTDKEAEKLIFDIYKSQLYSSAKKILINPEPLGNTEPFRYDELMDFLYMTTLSSECLSDAGPYSIMSKDPVLRVTGAIPLHSVLQRSIDSCTRIASRMMTATPTDSTEWRYLKVLGQPTLDKHFTAKSKDTRSLSSAIVGKKVIESLSVEPKADAPVKPKTALELMMERFKLPFPD